MILGYDQRLRDLSDRWREESVIPEILGGGEPIIQSQVGRSCSVIVVLHDDYHSVQIDVYGDSGPFSLSDAKIIADDLNHAVSRAEEIQSLPWWAEGAVDT